MSDVTLTVQRCLSSGITPSYTGSLLTTNTYLVNNDGRVILHFKKSEAVDAEITIVTPRTVDGLAVAERTVTVPATTGDKMIGPFPPAVYNDGQNLSFTSDNIAGLTVAVIKV